MNSQTEPPDRPIITQSADSFTPAPVVRSPQPSEQQGIPDARPMDLTTSAPVVQPVVEPMTQIPTARPVLPPTTNPTLTPTREKLPEETPPAPIALDPSSPPTCSQENLIVNGSFERLGLRVDQYAKLDASQIPGWESLNGNSIEVWGPEMDSNPPDGDHHIELDNSATTPLDGIYQDVETKAGRLYAVTFHIRSHTGNPGSETEAVIVQWGESEIGNYRASQPQVWTSISLRLLGTGQKMRLVFRESSKPGANTSLGPLLDNVELFEYPRCKKN